jgi:hypothetical protein
LGTIFAVLYLCLLIDSFAPERALAWHYAAGTVFIAAIATALLGLRHRVERLTATEPAL